MQLAYTCFLSKTHGVCISGPVDVKVLVWVCLHWFCRLQVVPLESQVQQHVPRLLRLRSLRQFIFLVPLLDLLVHILLVHLLLLLLALVVDLVRVEVLRIKVQLVFGQLSRHYWSLKCKVLN